jgi:hypothetical protein
MMLRLIFAGFRDEVANGNKVWLPDPLVNLVESITEDPSAVWTLSSKKAESGWSLDRVVLRLGRGIREVSDLRQP